MKKYKKYKQTEIDEVWQAYNAGMPLTAISAALDIPYTTIRTWIRETRGNQVRKYRRYSAADYITALDMVKSGISQCEVSRQLGLEQTRISKWIRGVLPKGVTKEDIEKERRRMNNCNNEVPLEVKKESNVGDMETLDLFIDYLLRACQGYKEMKRQLKERTGQVQQKNTELLSLTNRIQELLKP